MRLRRIVLPIAAASAFIATGCGGVTKFVATEPVLVAGTPLPAPKEEPKPPPRVELRNNRIEFKEKIQFEVNKAVIKEESFSLLHDIADVIKKNPHVKRISIEGHASAEGDAAHNKRLSDERAKAVMGYLAQKEEIAPDRLTARGWGEEKPLASNDTDEGREKNRRVEFLVVEQDVTAKKIEIDAVTGKERVVEEKKETYNAPSAPPTTGAETPSGKQADPGKADRAKDAAAKQSEGNKR